MVMGRCGCEDEKRCSIVVVKTTEIVVDELELDLCRLRSCSDVRIDFSNNRLKLSFFCTQDVHMM